MTVTRSQNQKDHHISIRSSVIFPLFFRSKHQYPYEKTDQKDAQHCCRSIQKVYEGQRQKYWRPQLWGMTFTYLWVGSCNDPDEWCTLHTWTFRLMWVSVILESYFVKKWRFAANIYSVEMLCNTTHFRIRPFTSPNIDKTCAYEYNFSCRMLELKHWIIQT